MKDISTNKVMYPLTHPQKRIWYTEKIYPNTPVHNLGGTIRIKGNVDFDILHKAIKGFIRHNESLHLRMVEENAEVMQYVDDIQEADIDFFDFSTYEDPEGECQKWIDAESKKIFDLTKDKLFYFAMFRIDESNTGYLGKFHHIISDGWSINLASEEISRLYMELLSNQEVNYENTNSYIEYIEKEAEYLASDRFIKNKNFWMEKFKDIPENLLVTSTDHLQGARKTFELEESLSEAIKRIGEENKWSLNIFFSFIFSLYLARTNLREEVVIGTPVLNRSGRKERNMFGMFTSSMPFRFTLEEENTVMEIMKQMSGEFKTCYSHQKYPYDLMIQDLELNKSGKQLYDICINYYNTKFATEINGMELNTMEVYNGNQIFALQLVIKDWMDSGKLELNFDYRVSNYTPDEIEKIFAALMNITKQIIENPSMKAKEIQLVSKEEEVKYIVEYNRSQKDYPQDTTIHRLFEEQVEKNPNGIAISFGEEKLTYQELNQRANQLARFLIKEGVKAESIVGLLTTHSLESIIGILGVIKAGGCYVPIDVKNPLERINYILEDTATDILLVNNDKAVELNFRGKVIDLGEEKIYQEDNTNLDVDYGPNSLVYIIYTSGSTGKPKGALLEHQGLINYIWWGKGVYLSEGKEIFPLYSSLAFDLTVTSIFLPLISGNQIMVYAEDDESGDYVLNRIMKDNKVTIMKLTPAHLMLLKEMGSDSSSLKKLIVGGEDLKVSLAKAITDAFNGDIKIFNEYGPTEATVGCMIHQYDYEKDTATSVPIGIPANNAQIYILDNQFKPLPAGATGEMYIAGDGLARGYLNRPELTKERFIENVFNKEKRMYKTGDLARFLDTGIIEYVGRIDHQVKIRGYRVELGEIESCIMSFGKIKDAVVLDRENDDKTKYLCGYFVPEEEISEEDLRSYLLDKLPDYMVPLYLIGVESIPLSSNGKVDRNKLLQIEINTSSDQDFVNSRNEKEKIVVEVICGVLGLEEVSVKDNFYRLGGDSIKAIQVASKINSLGYNIKVKDILSNPVLEQLAVYVTKDENPTIEQGLWEGSIPATPIVSWFFDEKFRVSSHYNQSILLELKESIDIDTLERIFNELINHHDTLRINYNKDEGLLYYENSHLDKSFKVEYHDLSMDSSIEQRRKMTEIGNSLKSSFNIEEGLLIKACIFDLGNNGTRLLLTAHHLIVDGVSWRIILDDIMLLFNQMKKGEKLELPPKTYSYKLWAEKLKEYSEQIKEEEVKHWKSVIDDGDENNRETDFIEESLENCAEITLQLSPEETEKILSEANVSYNTNTEDLLLIALIKALHETKKTNEVVIELEGHGREELTDEININRTIGWFTSMYPVKLNLDKEELGNQIKSIKEQLRKTPKNGIGYGLLKYLTQSIVNNKQRHIRFNYLGDFGNTFNNELFRYAQEDAGRDISPQNHLSSLMEINCFVIEGQLNVSITYSNKMYSHDEISRLKDVFTEQLRIVIAHCCEEEYQFTPSDFEMVDLSQDDLDSLFG